MSTNLAAIHFEGFNNSFGNLDHGMGRTRRSRKYEHWERRSTSRSGLNMGYTWAGKVGHRPYSPDLNPIEMAFEAKRA